MRQFGFFIVALTALWGCTTASDTRPQVETDTSGAGWDFSGVYDEPIYLFCNRDEVSDCQDEATSSNEVYVARERMQMVD